MPGVYSNKKTKINAIKTGLENGINLIDTAEFYHTEGIVSEAVKNFKRDEIFISTKVLPTHLSPKSLERALKRSLKIKYGLCGFIHNTFSKLCG
ncbi:aldo/keto reductase [Acidiplasma cupricumulans]|uniref:aldo/keto reductase n=1 Tax=Acidiplasma cupricumulans TaxID=312540 RepID=UPI000A90CB4E|nr:aldo/keto reductase [Acidiplasma cupricumulans]